MKKLLLLLMALSLSLALTANDKLSPGTKVFLQQRAQGINVPADAKTPLAKPKAMNGTEFIECFISLNGSSYSELQANGVQVTGKYDEFITASVPVQKLEQIAKLSSVKMVAIARNARHHTDVAKGIVNADKAWNGTNYGLPQGFKGEDIVLGIIDDGIEFNHRAFLKADGTSRVKAVYMPNASSANGGTRAVIDGVQLSGYQYTTPSQIAALTCDDSSESHGTHTTGCAAGSQVGNYAGMAPEADLVLAGCGASLTETAILNSAKYIGNYAKNVLGKPCVISISLGSDTGPHDGKSSICLGYNQVAEQYGAVILLAAGNEADILGHATKTLSSDDDYMTVICNVSGGWWGGGGTGACDIWNSTSDPLQVKVLIMSGSSVTSQSDWMSSGSFNGVTVQGAVDPNNGRYQLYIESSASKAAFVIKGKSGNEIHVYTDDYYASLASSGSVSGYTLTPGTYDGSMCDDMTAEKVISVGAQASRSTDGYGQGDVAYFSSYGTDFNGINHPLVTAPGHYVISSINDYDSYQSSTWSTTFNGKTYKWGEMSGTSMATPIAAGVVVLYLQADPTLDVDRVKEIITETATPYPASSTSPVKARGAGIINALGGIEYILQHQGPTIIAKPSELAFEGYAGETYTQTLTVKGYNLTTPITIEPSGDECYTVTPTTITPEEAYNGVTVTVTYAPTEAGTTSGTLTLSSDEAETQTVTLSGNAKPRVPTLIAEPQQLSFSAKLNRPMSKTINLKGLFLTSDVTITLDNPSNVFAVTPTTIAPDSFEGETPLQLTVTFTSAQEGNFTGSITIASEGAETQTIQLTANCSDNGTASDPFLDLAKYESIDEAGFTGISKLYNYTEYPEQDCAWLTVSNYGMMNNTGTQKWFTHGGEKKYGTENWSATDVFLGNTAYFSGSGYYANWNEDYQTFYVTNCSQVKQFAYNSGSTYPLLMDIYECTLNADGSITAGNTSIDHKTSTQYSTTEVISSIELNPEKIYKIAIYNDYSRLYEIGFRMPLETVATPVATEATKIGATSFIANWLPCEGALNYTLRVQPVVAQGLFTETFAKCETAGSQNIGNKLDEYTDNAGWTGSSVYSAVGGLRLGTGANVGTITTPAIDLTSSPGKVYVKFSAKTFTNNSGKSDADCNFKISCGDASETVVIPGAEEDSYMVALDCASAAGQNIKFETTAGGKRVIVTKVEIYNTEPATGAAVEPIIITNIADTTAYAVTGLLPETSYSFDVKAIYDPQVFGKAESSWSNMIFFKTLSASGIVGDVNGDGEVTGSDVTALYNAILFNDFSAIVNGDQNGDGEITGSDVTAVYNIILGL